MGTVLINLAIAAALSLLAFCAFSYVAVRVAERMLDDEGRD